MANTNLKEAKAAKNDEFYTQFHDIEIEMNAYLEYYCFNHLIHLFQGRHYFRIYPKKKFAN